MRQVWQAEDGKAFDTEKECKDYEKELNLKRIKVYGDLAGKNYYSEKEFWAAHEEMGRLGKKWIEQNDIEKLFGADNQNYHSIGTEEENELEYGLSHKIIFRSIDNQYFITDEECRIHEEKIKGKNLAKIIDRERVWRSPRHGTIYYFATQEECLLYERTAYDGTVFNTPEERIEYEDELSREEYENEMEVLGKESEQEVNQILSEREIYGVNWDDEDNSLNEEREEIREEEYWNRVDGTPN